jgi:hypothetical protein
MSLFRLILATLRFHWRTNLAVACGVAVSAAVLTGALLVGDSMRGSLRHLTLDRLGRIDEALVSEHFFRAILADQLTGKPGAAGGSPTAAPAILLTVSVENPDPQSPRRANRVQLAGCDGRFWQLGSGRTRSYSTNRWPSGSAFGPATRCCCVCRGSARFRPTAPWAENVRPSTPSGLRSAKSFRPKG